MIDSGIHLISQYFEVVVFSLGSSIHLESYHCKPIWTEIILYLGVPVILNPVCFIKTPKKSLLPNHGVQDSKNHPNISKCGTRCQFHQCSTSCFYASRSQKCKKDCQVVSLFLCFWERFNLFLFQLALPIQGKESN